METFQNLQETKLSSQPIFDGNVLHIYKDTVRLPNGKEASREYTVHHGAVCILPLLENGDVLLERQFRYPIGAVVMFIARGLSFGERELDEDEFLNVFRMPLQELVEKVLAGEIPDAKTQIAALRVWGMQQKGLLG